MKKTHYLRSMLSKVRKAKRNMSWKRGKKLGCGAFGSVYLAVKEDGVMAVKSAEFYRSRSLKKEADLIPKFEGCPQILHCYGADETKENGEKLYNVFLEYVPGGSLADRIKKSKTEGVLPEDQVKKYTKSLLLGLGFIHRCGYIHRDIKPANILLDGNGSVKIADFGLAKKYGKIKSTEKKKSKGLKGTVWYMAPEIVRQEVYEPPVDIWALGCTVVEMITGRPAWDYPNADPFAILFKIMSEGAPEIPKGLSKEAEDFVRKCLVENPGERWTADMLLNHPFVASMDEEKLPCNMELMKQSYLVNLPCNGGGFKNLGIGCC